jgi:hypothetical protein
MNRPARSVAAVVTTALLFGGAACVVAFSAGGCAMSSPADLTPDLDPTLPGVDAAFDPSPAEGGRKPPPPEPDGGSVDDDPVDAATPTVTKDAGGVDSAPPPPTVPKPAPGEVLITEVMYDSFGTEPDSEWFELYNKATSARTLSGLTIKDGGARTHVIGAGVTIAPGAYILLARLKSGAVASKIPASMIAYEYAAGLPSNAGVQLANGATGGLALLDGAVTITSAPYGGWFSQSGGSSAQLSVLDGTQSTSKASWCLSLNAWSTGSEKGTPGAAEDCP